MDKMEENKSIDRSDVQKNLYIALLEAYNSDKDLLSSYDEQRRLGKEESSRETTQKASKSISSSKGATRSPPKSSAKSNQEEEHEPRVADLEERLHQEFDIGNDVSPVREITKVDERLWNPLGSRTPDRTTSLFNEFLVTPIDFSAFMMNRLDIQNLTQDLLTGPTYDLIKHTCKSVVELEYHLEEVFKATNDQLDWHNPEGKPTYHWGPKRQRFYGYATNMETSKDVYSKHKIIAVTSLKIMEFFGYTHLEENAVRRQDDKLYKFRESDFKRLRREDIEVIRIVIQERVEDLQLAVESYQKKINLTKPDTYRSDISKKTPYTTYHDFQGIIYQDDMNRNRLMLTDELHKFNDDTLNHVRTSLNDIATGIQMEYLPKRKWTKQDKQRAQVMIKSIDKKPKDKRLMRSLEKFVGGRPYKGGIRLLQRTI
ncbi:hypothetical protein Tco_1338751 [Tanacetum coccineum]